MKPTEFDHLWTVIAPLLPKEPPQSERQPFLPVYPHNSLVVHGHAFPAQEDVQPWAAETSALLGELPQASAQGGVWVRAWRPPKRSPVHLHQLAGPPL